MEMGERAERERVRTTGCLDLFVSGHRARARGGRGDNRVRYGGGGGLCQLHWRLLWSELGVFLLQIGGASSWVWA